MSNYNLDNRATALLMIINSNDLYYVIQYANPFIHYVNNINFTTLINALQKYNEFKSSIPNLVKLVVNDSANNKVLEKVLKNIIQKFKKKYNVLYMIKNLSKLLGGYVHFPMIDEDKTEFTEQEKLLVNDTPPSITHFKEPTNLNLSIEEIRNILNVQKIRLNVQKIRRSDYSNFLNICIGNIQESDLIHFNKKEYKKFFTTLYFRHLEQIDNELYRDILNSIGKSKQDIIEYFKIKRNLTETKIIEQERMRIDNDIEILKGKGKGNDEAIKQKQKKLDKIIKNPLLILEEDKYIKDLLSILTKINDISLLSNLSDDLEKRIIKTSIIDDLVNSTKNCIDETELFMEAFNTYNTASKKFIPYYNKFERLGIEYNESGKEIARHKFILYRKIDNVFYTLIQQDNPTRFFYIDETLKVFKLDTSIENAVGLYPQTIPNLFYKPSLVHIFWNVKNYKTVMEQFYNIYKLISNETPNELLDIKNILFPNGFKNLNYKALEALGALEALKALKAEALKTLEAEALKTLEAEALKTLEAEALKTLEALEEALKASEVFNFGKILEYLFTPLINEIVPSQQKITNIMNVFFYNGDIDLAHKIFSSADYDFYNGQSNNSKFKGEFGDFKLDVKPVNINGQNIKNLISDISKLVNNRDELIKNLISDTSELVNKVNDRKELIEKMLNLNGEKLIIYNFVVLFYNLLNNEDIRKMAHVYNFLRIYDDMSKFKTTEGNKKVSEIKQKLSSLNKSLMMDENKMLYRFILDIIKCNYIFNKLNDKKYIRHAIDVFFAGSITRFDIPFNVNILCHKYLSKIERCNSITDDDRKNMDLFNKLSYKTYNYSLFKVYKSDLKDEPQPPCGETVVFNLINYLIFDGANLNVEWLPEHSLPFLKEFYSKYNTFYSIDLDKVNIVEYFFKNLQYIEFTMQDRDFEISMHGRRRVNINPYAVYGTIIMSDGAPIPYIDNEDDRKIYDDNGLPIKPVRKYKGYELRPGYYTIIRVLNHILGYSRESNEFNEEFVFKNINNDSLKKILSTFRNPKINEILANYQIINGDYKSDRIELNLDQLEGLFFDYNHADITTYNHVENVDYIIFNNLEEGFKEIKINREIRYYLHQNYPFDVMEKRKYTKFIRYFIQIDILEILLIPINILVIFLKNYFEKYFKLFASNEISKHQNSLQLKIYISIIKNFIQNFSFPLPIISQMNRVLDKLKIFRDYQWFIDTFDTYNKTDLEAFFNFYDERMFTNEYDNKIIEYIIFKRYTSIDPKIYMTKYILNNIIFPNYEYFRCINIFYYLYKYVSVNDLLKFIDKIEKNRRLDVFTKLNNSKENDLYPIEILIDNYNKNRNLFMYFLISKILKYINVNTIQDIFHNLYDKKQPSAIIKIIIDYIELHNYEYFRYINIFYYLYKYVSDADVNDADVNDLLEFIEIEKNRRLDVFTKLNNSKENDLYPIEILIDNYYNKNRNPLMYNLIYKILKYINVNTIQDILHNLYDKKQLSAIISIINHYIELHKSSGFDFYPIIKMYFICLQSSEDYKFGNEFELKIFMENLKTLGYPYRCLNDLIQKNPNVLSYLNNPFIYKIVYDTLYNVWLNIKSIEPIEAYKISKNFDYPLITFNYVLIHPLNKDLLDKFFDEKLFLHHDLHHHLHRDIYGNTIYHILAMKYMNITNISINKILSEYPGKKINEIFNFLFKPTIASLTNNEGWSVIDILSIIPFNNKFLNVLDDGTIQKYPHKPNYNPYYMIIKDHIRQLYLYYEKKFIAINNKIIHYIYFYELVLYPFSKNLLKLVDDFRKKKPGIIPIPISELYKYVKFYDHNTQSKFIEGNNSLSPIIPLKNHLKTLHKIYNNEENNITYNTKKDKKDRIINVSSMSQDEKNHFIDQLKNYKFTY